MTIFLKNHWQIIALFLLSFLISWPLFLPGYFSHHDDLQVMRIFEMRKCFSDFQIPCRWVPDMGWGNGFPLFNYYSAFPYYLGAIFSYLVGYVNAAKILFFIPLVLGIYPVFLLTSEIFNKKLGFLAGLLYMFAPYRALDLYVRGAVAEAFGMSLAPLVLFFALKLIKSGKYRYLLGVSISLAAFLTSHNIMTLFFSWLIGIWVLGLLIYYRFKSFAQIIISFVIGFMLSAFFLVPVFLEKNLVNTDNLTKADLNFRANFVSINQLFFDRYWGYGASIPGTQDTISFQIGWPIWWLALFSLVMIPFIFFWKNRFISVNLKIASVNKIDKETMLYWLFFAVIFLVSIFMMHGKSSFIWELLPLLQYAQFPWRFLSLTIFSGSVLAVFWLLLVKEKMLFYCIIFISFLAITLNISYFRPDEFYYDITDNQKLLGVFWEEQRKSSILDYLPKKSLQPREPAQSQPIIRSGKASVSGYQNFTNHFQFTLNVSQKSQIEVPIFNFPNWQIWINGKKAVIDDNNYLARISFVVEPGQHQVKGYLENTWIRTLSNLLTVLGFGLLIIVLVYGKNKKTF